MRKVFKSFSGSSLVEDGVIKNVSLMQAGEALGHGLLIDLKTLQGAYTIGQGIEVKSYVNHSSNPAPTEIIGFFNGLHIDGDKLKAENFTFLKAFKENYKAEYETLLELARDHPSAFGVSLSTIGKTVWVLEDETEVDGELARPDNAKYSMPTFRIQEMASADVVSQPAANRDGLFSEKNFMTIEELEAKLTEALATLAKQAETITALESRIVALEPKEEAKKEPAPEVQASTPEVAKLSARIGELEGRLVKFGAPRVDLGEPVSEGATIKEQYEAITNFKAKLAFFRKHKEELSK